MWSHTYSTRDNTIWKKRLKLIKIYTKRLALSKLLSTNEVTVVDVLDNKSLINHILNIKKLTSSIEIWDVTKGYNPGCIVEVSDHINKTGKNPLFGNQKALGIDFPDITSLYQSENGVITSCYGESFDKINDKNISTWMCHISIVSRALGIERINAKLISI